jgi:hypothetical protein
VSPHGFWLLLRSEELFVPFSEFPWFRDASIGEISHVELPSAEHLFWPELDVDLAVESIRGPSRFPLVMTRRFRGSGKAIDHPVWEFSIA